MMTVRSLIISQFEQVSREQSKPLVALTDGTMLLDTGLDSLCFAIVVARLEDNLGFDPFQIAEEQRFPVTFGEFVRLYENAAERPVA